MAYLNALSGSLVSSPRYDNVKDVQRHELLSLADRVISVDPEFVLKVKM